MIVPDYWAEATARGELRGQPITVRRFGWSTDSDEHAQHMAEERAKAALLRAQTGEPLPRHEPKVPYNGADGVPIREEVIARDGDTVVTRNSYGALCLNTPDVLFADVDGKRAAPIPISGIGSFAIAYLVGSIFYHRSGEATAGVAATIALMVSAPILHGIASLWMSHPASAQRRVLRALSRLAGADRSVLFDLYQTPLGHRVLARHKRFDPTRSETTSGNAAHRSRVRANVREAAVLPRQSHTQAVAHRHDRSDEAEARHLASKPRAPRRSAPLDGSLRAGFRGVLSLPLRANYRGGLGGHSGASGARTPRRAEPGTRRPTHRMTTRSSPNRARVDQPPTLVPH